MLFCSLLFCLSRGLLWIFSSIAQRSSYALLCGSQLPPPGSGRHGSGTATFIAPRTQVALLRTGLTHSFGSFYSFACGCLLSLYLRQRLHRIAQTSRSIKPVRLWVHTPCYHTVTYHLDLPAAICRTGSWFARRAAPALPTLQVCHAMRFSGLTTAFSWFGCLLLCTSGLLPRLLCAALCMPRRTLTRL